MLSSPIDPKRRRIREVAVAHPGVLPPSKDPPGAVAGRALLLIRGDHPHRWEGNNLPANV